MRISDGVQTCALPIWAKAALSKAKDRTPVPISFGMVSRPWLSRLLAGANVLHRLELAQAAACATIKPAAHIVEDGRSEEQTSALHSLMSISYAVLCLKKNNRQQ